MKRLVLTPLVVAAALAAGAVSAADTKDAQSYGYYESEGATYEETIADESTYRAGDAYAQVYGDGRANDYRDYDGRYGDGVVSGIAGSDPLIVPDRYGRDGEFAMARVVDVSPLVSRDAGCRDGRYAEAGSPYRGQAVSRDGDYYGDGRRTDGYYEDGYYEDDGYARSGDDGYYDPRYGQPQGYGYGEPYGRPPPRTSGMGAAIGAILGGVIGNEIADDDDHYYGYSGEQAAATMIGALLGGAVGAGIERQVVLNREQRYYEQRPSYGQPAYRGQPAASYEGGHAACAADAYRVTYEYAGRRYEAVTDYDPGDEMRVRIEVR